MDPPPNSTRARGSVDAPRVSTNDIRCIHVPLASVPAAPLVREPLPCRPRGSLWSDVRSRKKTQISLTLRSTTDMFSPSTLEAGLSFWSCRSSFEPPCVFSDTPSISNSFLCKALDVVLPAVDSSSSARSVDEENVVDEHSRRLAVVLPVAKVAGAGELRSVEANQKNGPPSLAVGTPSPARILRLRLDVASMFPPLGDWSPHQMQRLLESLLLRLPTSASSSPVCGCQNLRENVNLMVALDSLHNGLAEAVVENFEGVHKFSHHNSVMFMQFCSVLCKFSQEHLRHREAGVPSAPLLITHSTLKSIANAVVHSGLPAVFICRLDQLAVKPCTFNTHFVFRMRPATSRDWRTSVFSVKGSITSSDVVVVAVGPSTPSLISLPNHGPGIGCRRERGPFLREEIQVDGDEDEGAAESTQPSPPWTDRGNQRRTWEAASAHVMQQRKRRCLSP